MPLIEGCAFEANTADELGGAILNQTDAAPLITGCTLTGNSAPLGGAVASFEATSTITNCVLTMNAAPTGAALSNQTATAVVTNCTIADNTGADVLAVAVLNLGESSATLTNCILWNPEILELPVVGGDTFTVQERKENKAAAAGGGLACRVLKICVAAIQDLFQEFRGVGDVHCAEQGQPTPCAVAKCRNFPLRIDDRSIRIGIDGARSAQAQRTYAGPDVARSDGAHHVVPTPGSHEYFFHPEQIGDLFFDQANRFSGMGEGRELPGQAGVDELEHTRLPSAVPDIHQTCSGCIPVFHMHGSG